MDEGIVKKADRVDGNDQCERMCVGMAYSGKTPLWIKPYLEKAAPAIRALCIGIEKSSPIIQKCLSDLYDMYEKLPREVVRVLWGLALCFYGGRYSVIISAVDAFQVTGGTAMIDCMKDVIAQAKKIREANAIDDAKDEDRNGVADVDGLQSTELVKRKMVLLLRTADPVVLSNGVGGLWSGYVAMLTVLKFKFVQTVALGHSIGDTIRPIAVRTLSPSISLWTPPDFRHWINPAIDCSCKVFAGFLAWRLQQAVATVQFGVRGGLIAMRGLLELLRKHNYWKLADDSSSRVDEVGGYSLALCGIYWQIFGGRVKMPFFLAPAFWPLDILEWWLKWSVTWIAQDTSSSHKALTF